MVLLTLVCQLSPEGLIRIFSPEPAVVAFGAEYLRIISWNFIASGLIFSSSSMFQALGNTWPPLASSATRLFLFAAPAAILSRFPGFAIREVWHLSVFTVAVQAAFNLILLNREFGRKLRFAEPSVAPAAAGDD